MIISQISGGLGNQLFQYALGRHIALKYNTDLKLDLDIYKNPIEGLTLRVFELNNLNLNCQIASQDEIRKIKRADLKGIFKSIYWRTQTIKPYYRKNFIKEKSHAFDKNILKCPDNSYIEGYWQSEKYFSSIRNILLKELQPKSFQSIHENSFYNKIINSNAISVHIRRGDYISNPVHKDIYKTIPIDYYHSAMLLYTKKIENPIFFIFSDDFEWVKSFFNNNNNNITFVEIENAVTCMYLMSVCKHNIIANSSFSWWGAWLNQNENKIVISPSEWFTSNSGINAADLISENWIKI